MQEHQNAAPRWPAGTIIGLGQMDDKPLQWGVIRADTRVWFSSKQPNETVYVRPIIAISLEPSKTAVDRNTFRLFDYSFCGTENADCGQPCTCGGFSPGKQFNMQQGHSSVSGCLITAAMLLLIVLGGMSLYGCPIDMVVFALIAVCTIPGMPSPKGKLARSQQTASQPVISTTRSESLLPAPSWCRAFCLFPRTKKKTPSLRRG